MTVQSATQPPPALTIAEPSQAGEVAAIADLYPGKNDKQKREMIERSLIPEFAAGRDGRRTILLARIDDALVGTVQIVWEDSAEEPALLPPGAAVIHHFRTHPDYRRRGIGRCLMDEAERRARQRNVELLTLGVEPANENAHRLYEKWGFRDVLTYRGTEGEIIIGMVKRLHPA